MTRLAIALLLGLAPSCTERRTIGQPCDRGEACHSGVCTIGLGNAGAICSTRCRPGEGRGSCPTGWECAGTGKMASAPSAAQNESICVPVGYRDAQGQPAAPAPARSFDEPTAR